MERGNRNAVQQLLRPSAQAASNRMREEYAGRNLAEDSTLRGYKGEHGSGLYFPMLFEGQMAGLPLSGIRVGALIGFCEIEGGLHYSFVVLTQPPDPDFEARALEVVRSASARIAPTVDLWLREGEGPAEPLVAKLRSLASAGDPLAPVFLGDLALGGAGGVKRDRREAQRWYQLGADRGAAEGFYGLARMHRNGRGVPKDDAAAVRWADKAANRGSAQALVVLGRAHEHGSAHR